MKTFTKLYKEVSEEVAEEIIKQALLLLQEQSNSLGSRPDKELYDTIEKMMKPQI